MDKENVLKWLRQCTDADQDAVCAECPYAECEDCAGALMQAAADVIENKEA